VVCCVASSKVVLLHIFLQLSHKEHTSLETQMTSRYKDREREREREREGETERETERDREKEKERGRENRQLISLQVCAFCERRQTVTCVYVCVVKKENCKKTYDKRRDNMDKARPDKSMDDYILYVVFMCVCMARVCAL
jgi:hypothetical protein